MNVFLLHFLLGLAGGGLLFWGLMRLAGERSTSAPFGPLLIGLTCGQAAFYISPWATPVILVSYLLFGLIEWHRNRRG